MIFDHRIQSVLTDKFFFLEIANSLKNILIQIITSKENIEHIPHEKKVFMYKVILTTHE